VASLSEHAKDQDPQHWGRCLACGQPLEAPLSIVGSLRCLDCRDVQAPLNPELVALWQKRGSRF
jgi:hypothetical protein